jgi:hypothetical protein
LSLDLDSPSTREPAALAAGQARLASATRSVVARAAPPLARRLLPLGDQPFLEPLLFAWLEHPSPGMPLEQVLAGYADGEQETPLALEPDGRAYVPRVGWIRPATAAADLRLRREGGAWSVRDGDRRIAATIDSLPAVGDGIEMHAAPPALLAPLLGAESSRAASADAREPQVARAFALMRELAPDLWSDVRTAVRGVVVFEAEGLNSFASPAAHGLAFVNAALGADEVFFLEDLAHQCGHVVFSAQTLDKEECFEIDPETKLGTLTGVEDPRSLYVALHGIVTEAAMVRCLDAALTAGVFAGRQRHELIGRLGFALMRFANDLANLAHPAVFSARGRRLYSGCREAFADVLARRAELIRGLDLSGHPYNFSYAAFAARNGR